MWKQKLNPLTTCGKPCKISNLNKLHGMGTKHSDLNSCTHVFHCNDLIRPSLSHPYEGPYQVVERSEKFFKIKINNKENTISINRLKPAYITGLQPVKNNLEPRNVAPNYRINSEPALTSNRPQTTTAQKTNTELLPTLNARSGHRVRIPFRFFFNPVSGFKFSSLKITFLAT